MYIQLVIPMNCYLKSQSLKFGIKMVSTSECFSATKCDVGPSCIWLITSNFKRHLNSSCFTGFIYHSKWCTNSMSNVHQNKMYPSLIKIKTHFQFRKDETWKKTCLLPLSTYALKRGSDASALSPNFIQLKALYGPNQQMEQN